MRNWAEIAQSPYDVIIIGGGINGAGVARDAALRGLKTILLDKNDFASGTSSWSTRLVHGGLRYLEQFEISLVRESLREREVLLRNAPHLVKPLLLTVPIYQARSRPFWKVCAGMWLYDILSFDKSVPSHRMLKRDIFQQVLRSLDHEGLSGGAQYYDAQAEYAERLCLENIFAARSAGATVCNYVTVQQLNQREGRIATLTCQDTLTGKTFEIQGRDRAVVINTAGPWVDQVLNSMTPECQSERKIGGTKGSHIVVDCFPGMPNHTALYVEAQSDGRPFFIVPWLGQVLIGTTDLLFAGDLDRVKANDAEIDYLLNETNLIIPTANLTRQDVRFTYSGVRPLPYTEGKATGNFTRKHTLHDHQSEGVNNLLSLIGGKLTTYRHVGEEIVDWIYEKWQMTPVPCPTLKQPLPGYIAATDKRIQNAINQYTPRLSRETLNHLFTLYGAQAFAVLKLVDESPDLGALIVPNLPDIRAQIVYAVQQEMALTYGDILRRRTTIAMQANYGFDAIAVVSDVLQNHCGWTTEQCDRATVAYYEYMQQNCVPDYQLNAAADEPLPAATTSV